MITQGQLIFAILFFIGFVVLTAYSYQKDKKLHKRYYKGSRYILLGFIVFMGILFALKYLMK